MGKGKKSAVLLAVGALGGGVCLAGWWLWDKVLGSSPVAFQDGAFFTGLVLVLAALLSLTRGGKSSHASTGISSPSNAGAQAAFAADMAFQEQKITSDPKLAHREKGPSLTPVGLALLAAGAVNLAAFGAAVWLGP